MVRRWGCTKPPACRARDWNSPGDEEAVQLRGVLRNISAVFNQSIYICWVAITCRVSHAEEQNLILPSSCLLFSWENKAPNPKTVGKSLLPLRPQRPHLNGGGQWVRVLVQTVSSSLYTLSSPGRNWVCPACQFISNASKKQGIGKVLNKY